MQKKRDPATTWPSQRSAVEKSLMELCLPDVSSESFRRMCERESLSLTNDPHEAEVLDWIAKVSDSDAS